MSKPLFIPVPELQRTLNKHHELSATSIGRVLVFLLALRAGTKAPRYFSRKYALAFAEWVGTERPSEMLAANFIHTETGKKVAQEERAAFAAEVVRHAESEEGFTEKALANLLGVSLSAVGSWRRQRVIFLVQHNGRKIIDLEKFLDRFTWTF